MTTLIKICICDDRIDDLERLYDLVERFSAANPEYAIKVRKFQSTYDLLDCIEEDCSFDVFILDILLPHVNGIELAKKIRQRKEPCEIIFVTVSREYGIDAFGVNASNYIVKPIEKEDFDRVLGQTIERLALHDKKPLIVKVKGGMRKIAAADIISVESLNRKRIITLINNEPIETSTTLTSLFELLQDDARFFMPHRAFIINLEHVSGIMGSEVLMQDGQRIPVSRNCGKDFKEAYFKILF